MYNGVNFENPNNVPGYCFMSTTLGQILSGDDSSNHLQYVVARSKESVVSMINRIILWTGLRNHWSLHQTNLSLLRSIKTNSGTHPDSYSMGNGGSLPGSKVQKVCSPLESSAKAKNEWCYTSMLPCAIMLGTETTLPDQAK